jgi:hypothetical protein
MENKYKELTTEQVFEKTNQILGLLNGLSIGDAKRVKECIEGTANDVFILNFSANPIANQNQYQLLSEKTQS